MSKPAQAKAILRLELNTLEADVAFDEIRLTANTEAHLVIMLTNQAGERVSVLLPKQTLKEVVNWRMILSL